MEAMAWWLIPIVATLLAVIWVTWRARPRRPVDPHHSLAAHRRFTEALSPPTQPSEVTGAGDDDAQVSPQNRRTA